MSCLAVVYAHSPGFYLVLKPAHRHTPYVVGSTFGRYVLYKHSYSHALLVLEEFVLGSWGIPNALHTHREALARVNAPQLTCMDTASWQQHIRIMGDVPQHRERTALNVVDEFNYKPISRAAKICC